MRVGVLARSLGRGLLRGRIGSGYLVPLSVAAAVLYASFAANAAAPAALSGYRAASVKFASKLQKPANSARPKGTAKPTTTNATRKAKLVSGGVGLAAAAATAGSLAAKGTPSNPVPASVRRDGEAEARLIEVYRSVGKGQIREALAQAESLVRAHPNFQLAQLIYGDLLSARTRTIQTLGDVPEATARAASGTLAELREESALRIKALRERPPAGTIPAQFLQLAPRNRHAIAVDASRSRLYLFEHDPAAGLKLISDYYISVGKAGIEKKVEGDLRTPLGVYFIVSNISPKTLKDFYGSGALPINYPNPLDQRRGKTGSGIWLHGTPPNQFARAPRASDGCVVLANPDLDHLLNTVRVRDTPVVIAQSLNWVAPQSTRADASQFEAMLQGWRSAKSSGDLARTMAYYAPDFRNDARDVAAWAGVVQKDIQKAPGREILLKDLSVLRWHESAGDTMVVTFDEVVDGVGKPQRKRQYWSREGSRWRIFYEGNIG